MVDGGSTDNTEEVVRSFQKDHPGIRYFRLGRNNGIDQDFAEAVRLAQGEYCWLFSDDDLFRPDAIDTVLRVIRDHYALIIANAEVCNRDFTKVLERARLPLIADKIYKPGETAQVLADCGRYLSFIGCVIIRNDLWRSREKERYFGSYFIHVGVIFQEPLPGDTLVIAKPLISIRYGNAMWLARYFEIWMFKWPNLIWSFRDYPDAAKARVCPREPWRNLARLMIHRAKGTYTIARYAEWLEPRLRSRWTRVLSKAIAYCPGRIANLFGFIYYSVFSRNSARLLVLSDMINSPFYCLKSRGGRTSTRQQ